MSGSMAPLTVVDDVYGPLANLPTINWSRLLQHSEAEISALLLACETHGFFYLDMTDEGSAVFLEQLASISEITKAWFHQPLDKKMETETIGDAHGFKPTGIQSGAADHTKDGFEALKICRNNLVERSHLPSVVDTNMALFDSFVSTSHHIAKSLVSLLSSALGLEGSQNLTRYHNDDARSKTTLYFLHYPENLHATETGQNMHTDIGSITLLFAPQWGLQVICPDTKTWKYVAPRAGHAIINVADTLRFLSGRKLRSALHRVMPLGGRQVGDRYATSYFLRADDDTVFLDSEGEVGTAEQWLKRKYETYKLPHEIQKAQTILTGGMAQFLSQVQMFK